MREHPLVEWNNGSFGTHLCLAPVFGGGGPGSLTVDLKDTSLRDHSFTTPGGLVVANAWQHVAATYNMTDGNATLYVNGAIVAKTNIGFFRPMTTGDLYFGVRPYDMGAGLRYAGQMDEITLYKRALSPVEIHAIFAAGHAGKREASLRTGMRALPTTQQAERP